MSFMQILCGYDAIRRSKRAKGRQIRSVPRSDDGTAEMKLKEKRGSWIRIQVPRGRVYPGFWPGCQGIIHSVAEEGGSGMICAALIRAHAKPEKTGAIISADMYLAVFTQIIGCVNIWRILD
jgi:hypothetical protein